MSLNDFFKGFNCDGYFNGDNMVIVEHEDLRIPILKLDALKDFLSKEGDNVIRNWDAEAHFSSDEYGFTVLRISC